MVFMPIHARRISSIISLTFTLILHSLTGILASLDMSVTLQNTSNQRTPVCRPVEADFINIVWAGRHRSPRVNYSDDSGVVLPFHVARPASQCGIAASLKPPDIKTTRGQFEVHRSSHEDGIVKRKETSAVARQNPKIFYGHPTAQNYGNWLIRD